MSSEPAASRDRLPPGWLDRGDIQQRVLAELAARSGFRRRRRRALTSVAAAIVLVCAGAMMWRRAAPAPAVALSTSAAGPRLEKLPDGSLVELKGDAAITIDFSGELRRVTLTRGTAHFAVTKNPARPFVVTAGRVAVRAVGTAFSVELAGPAVEVLVTEGRVAVAPVGAPTAAPQLAIVDAGSGVVLNLATPAPAEVRDVAPALIEEKLAWRVRLLEFSGTPLAEAVVMLNRHNREQFVLADLALGSVKLSGIIRADRIAGVLRLLEEDCGIRAERRSDTEIVLHRAR